MKTKHTPAWTAAELQKALQKFEWGTPQERQKALEELLAHGVDPRIKPKS